MTDAKPQAVLCDHGLEHWGKGCHITHWDHIEKCPARYMETRWRFKDHIDALKTIRAELLARGEAGSHSNPETCEGYVFRADDETEHECILAKDHHGDCSYRQVEVRILKAREPLTDEMIEAKVNRSPEQIMRGLHILGKPTR
jgi:hypothetical protein